MRKAKCDICGKEFEAQTNYGKEFGIVRLDGRGHVYLEFDLCEECLCETLDMLTDKVTK